MKKRALSIIAFAVVLGLAVTAHAQQGWTVVPPDNTSTCMNWTVSEPATLLTTARRAGIARKATFAARCKDPRMLMCLETAPPPSSAR